MLETIVNWMLDVLSEAINGMMRYLYSLLDMDLAEILGYFPFLAGAYQILQACAIGLILAVAGWNLLKFFGGKMTNVRDTPFQILARSGLATVLVFSGGYLLTFIVDLASQPYELFRGLDAVTTTFSGSIVPGVADFVALGIGSGSTIFVALVFVILITWNLVKLFIEIVERYILVGVLAYTSPVFYPFLCSTSMSEVFSKWLGMFLGQCALMSVSVVFSSMVCSVFSNQALGPNSIMKILFGLAMCKVAQRADTYMQQLGLGVATTGQNLFSDIVALGMMAGRSIRGGFGGGGGNGPGGDTGGNSRKSVLGSKALGFGGIVGFAANAAKARKDGATGFDMFKQGAKATARNSVPGCGIVDRYRQAQQLQRDQVAQASVANETLFNNRMTYWARQRKGASTTGGAVGTTKYADIAKSAGMTAQQYWRTQSKLNGSGHAVVAPPGDGKDTSGAFALNGAAQAAGLQISDVQYMGETTGNDASLQSTRMLTGPDQVVASHIRDNYNVPDQGLTYGENQEIDAVATRDYQNTMVNTLRYGAPIVSEDILFGDDKTLEANDELSAAAIESTFGKDVIPDSARGLHDIKAETTPIEKTGDGQIITGGGRTVTATYDVPVYDKNGQVQKAMVNGKEEPVTQPRRFEIMDEVAYSQMNQADQWKMQVVQSRNGGTYYVRRTEVSQIHADAPTGGSYQPSSQTTLRDTPRPSSQNTSQDIPRHSTLQDATHNESTLKRFGQRLRGSASTVHRPKD